MTYRLDDTFRDANGPAKAKIREIDDLLAVMVDRLNGREVVDARPAIGGWMEQAMNPQTDVAVRAAALEATKGAIMHIGFAVHFNRKDSGSAEIQINQHFTESLIRRADTLVDLLPEPETLLQPMAALAQETNDPALRKAACSAYVAVRNNFVIMTGYRDTPERASSMHALHEDVSAPDFILSR